MPQWVPAHLIYHSDVSKRLDAIPDGLHPADAWRRTKQAMTAAAQTTLRAALAAKPKCPAQGLTVLMQLSRAIARGDGRMARLAIRSLPQFAEAVSVTGDCDVAIVDARLLDSAATAIVRVAHLAPTDLCDARQSPLGGGTAPIRHRAQHQWAQLWLPFGRRSAIAEVLLPDKPSRGIDSTRNDDSGDDARCTDAPSDETDDDFFSDDSRVGAGAPQGCPLSAILFVLTAHPLLAMLRSTIPEMDAHMAYADDLAAVLACKEALTRLPPVFAAWHKASWMKLIHGKTTIIPLDTFFNGEGDALGRMTQYVASLDPSWNAARVRQRKAPIEKWRHRSRQLAASGVAHYSTLREYRGRALPCLRAVRLVAAKHLALRAAALRHDDSLPLLCMSEGDVSLWTPSPSRSCPPCGGVLPRRHPESSHATQRIGLGVLGGVAALSR